LCFAPVMHFRRLPIGTGAYRIYRGLFSDDCDWRRLSAFRFQMILERAIVFDSIAFVD
jgi:hypothetical protein